MDPFNLKASLRALAASNRQEPASIDERKQDPMSKLGSKVQADIVKEAPPGLLERAGGTVLSGLATVGNLLDVPGSMVRDLATWLPGGPAPANPLDQVFSPFTDKNRTTGRDLLRGYGLAGKEDTMGNFTTGLAAEMALDPLTYLTFGAGALTRGGRAARAAGLSDNAQAVAQKLLKRNVGRREARHVTTPRMLLESIAPNQRAAKLEQLKRLGMQDVDLDRQLGGLLRINRPFSDKPFTWGGKPVTFGGLTDESGVVGAGRLRFGGRGKAPPTGNVPPSQPTPPSPAPIAPQPTQLPPTGPVTGSPQLPPKPPGISPEDLISDNGPDPVQPVAPSPPIPPASVPPIGVEEKAFLDGLTSSDDKYDVEQLLGIVGASNPSDAYKLIAKGVEQKAITKSAGNKAQQRLVNYYSKNISGDWVDVPDGKEITVSSPGVGTAKAKIAGNVLQIKDVLREENAVGSGRALLAKIKDASVPQNPSSALMFLEDNRTLNAFSSVFGEENLLFVNKDGKPFSTKQEAAKAVKTEPVFAFKIMDPSQIKPKAELQSDVVEAPRQTEAVQVAKEEKLPDQITQPDVPSKVSMVDDEEFLTQTKTSVPASAAKTDLVSTPLVQQANKEFVKPVDVSQANSTVPTKSGGSVQEPKPDDVSRKSQALIKEIANKRGASDAEVADMIIRGDVRNAIRRLQVKPLEGLKLDGLKAAVKKNGIMSDEKADQIFGELKTESIKQEYKANGGDGADIASSLLSPEPINSLRGLILARDVSPIRISEVAEEITKKGGLSDYDLQLIKTEAETAELLRKKFFSSIPEEPKPDLSNKKKRDVYAELGKIKVELENIEKLKQEARLEAESALSKRDGIIAREGVDKLEGAKTYLQWLKDKTSTLGQAQRVADEWVEIESGLIKEKGNRAVTAVGKSKLESGTAEEWKEVIRKAGVSTDSMRNLGLHYLFPDKSTVVSKADLLGYIKSKIPSSNRKGSLSVRDAERLAYSKKTEMLTDLYRRRLEYFNSLPKDKMDESYSISSPPLAGGIFDEVDRAFIAEKGEDADILFREVAEDWEIREQKQGKSKSKNKTKSDDQKLLSRSDASPVPFEYGQSVDVDWKRLEPLPEDAKKIVGKLVSNLDDRFFEGISLRYGSQGPDASAMAQIDLANGLIDIFDNSIKSGRVTEDTVHEIWHHLSRYFTDAEVRGVSDEYQRALAAFSKSNPGESLPYHLTSIDEYVGKRMADLSIEYLGREKPVGFMATAWGKMLEVFEYLWDTTLKTLGYNQTKSIMKDFLDGKRSPARITDNTLASRVDEVFNETLESRVPSSPTPAPSQLSSREIAQQLSEFNSPKMAGVIDRLIESMSNSSAGRQMSALFDQSVLGALSVVGQRVSRLAFSSYKDSVVKMRKDLAPTIKTWVGLDKINEGHIADNELAPLDDYIRQHGSRPKAEQARMKDARVIRNQRYNGLLRLAETPLLEQYRNSSGQLENRYVNITEQNIATLAPWIDQSKRQGVAEMINKFRYLNLQMIERESLHGIMTSFLNRYFPRLKSPIPGASDMPWNPNFGEILDPTHPNQRRRDSALDGYTDGTAVVNDISVDPEFSGVFSRKNIREDMTSPQIAMEVDELARKLWAKYGDRLDNNVWPVGYDALDDVLKTKINSLARKMANLDHRYADNAIPLFSTDMISAMMQRLEHSHRASAHANVIRDLVREGILHKSFYVTGDSKATNLRVALIEGDYSSPMAVQRIIKDLRKNSKDVIYDADKKIWENSIEPVIQSIRNDIANGTRNQSHAVGQVQGTNLRYVMAPLAEADEKMGLNKYELLYTYDATDPLDQSKQMLQYVEVVPGPANTNQLIMKNVVDPSSVSKTRYTSDVPPQFQLQALTIPREVADEIKRFVRPPKALNEVMPLIRYYDKFTNVWKMMQTGMLPFLGFHTRNLGSGQASNLYTGIQTDPRFKFNLMDPTTYANPIRAFFTPIKDAHDIATGGVVKQASEIPEFKALGLDDEAATERLRQEAFALGITGERQGLAAEQLQEAVDSISSQYPGIAGSESINPFKWKWSKPVQGTTFSQRWLQPWMMKGGVSSEDVFRPGQLGKDLAGYTESLNRLSPYIAMRRQGYNPMVAAKLVNEAQVDYTALSNFNRDYTRRMFPFAAYTIGITPTVARTLSQRPGGLMGQTIMATTQAGQGDDQGVTPDYIRETASIPLGMSEDGTRSYITGFGLPFEDPLQFTPVLRGNISGSLREIGSRMNPIPKALIETMTGESLYQSGPFGGREIEDLDPTIGRIGANIKDLLTGSKTEQARPLFNNPWLEYAIMNSGLGRTLNTVRTATDPRKWDTIPPWKLALNLGTGVRIADVSPAAQDAILRERLARVMKDFGGRMYTRPYFPDYAKENWTPEEAADAAKIDALMKLLGQRAKERRV